MTTGMPSMEPAQKLLELLSQIKDLLSQLEEWELRRLEELRTNPLQINMKTPEDFSLTVAQWTMKVRYLSSMLVPGGAGMEVPNNFEGSEIQVPYEDFVFYCGAIKTAVRGLLEKKKTVEEGSPGPKIGSKMMVLEVLSWFDALSFKLTEQEKELFKKHQDTKKIVSTKTLEPLFKFLESTYTEAPIEEQSGQSSC